MNFQKEMSLKQYESNSQDEIERDGLHLEEGLSSPIKDNLTLD